MGQVESRKVERPESSSQNNQQQNQKNDFSVRVRRSSLVNDASRTTFFFFLHTKFRIFEHLSHTHTHHINGVRVTLIDHFQNW